MNTYCGHFLTERTSPDKFSIMDIPGKGKGLVATRPIAAGELVFAESPLFTTSTELISEQMVIEAIRENLTVAQAKDFLSLKNAAKGGLPHLCGILITNFLPCGNHVPELGEYASMIGYFPTAVRINHHCRPNINNYWNDRTQQIRFYAVRDVAPGEELCVSYLDVLTHPTKAIRGAKFKEIWDFECTCSVCSLTGEELRASDARRTTIARIYDELPTTLETPIAVIKKVSPRSLNPRIAAINSGCLQCKLAVRMMELEGIKDRYADGFYCDAFRNCIGECRSHYSTWCSQLVLAWADVQNARAWAVLAWEAHCRLRGADSPEAHRSEDWYLLPNTVPYYGRHGKKTIGGPDVPDAAKA